MTVTDLIMNFRNGLLGLASRFEQVGVPWKRPDAYDEWDNCVAAVFHALVFEPLRCALPEDEREAFSLPEYDMLLPTYAGLHVIEVMPSSGERCIRVFHALGSRSSPFDVVEVRAVRQDGVPQTDDLETIPLEVARFEMRVCAKGSPDRVAD